MPPEALRQADSAATYPAPQRCVRPETKAGSINVLVVEDDLADTSLILDVLERHPSVATAQAADTPHLALGQLADGDIKPDLVLLDIRMPRMDGFEFLDRFRQIPGMFDTPVVFLTNSALASDVIEAKQRSACSYVIKPETYEELRKRLDNVIRITLSSAWSR